MRLLQEVQEMIKKRVQQNWEGYQIGTGFIKEDIKEMHGFEPDVLAVGITWHHKPTSALLLKELNLRELREVEAFILEERSN